MNLEGLKIVSPTWRKNELSPNEDGKITADEIRAHFGCKPGDMQTVVISPMPIHDENCVRVNWDLSSGKILEVTDVRQ